MAQSFLYCSSLPGFINLFQMILSGLILGIMTQQDIYLHQLTYFKWELWTLLLAAVSLVLTFLACLVLALPKLDLLKAGTLKVCMSLFAVLMLGWVVGGSIEAVYATRLKALLAPSMRALDMRQPHELIPLYQRFHIRALLAGLSFGQAVLCAGALLLAPAHVSQSAAPLPLYAARPLKPPSRSTLI